MISEERKAELKAKYENGEIDFYDYHDAVHNPMEGITSWSCALFDDEDNSDSSNHGTKKELNGEPKFFLVKIRISNGRIYTVAKVPIKNQSLRDEEEAELYNYYCKKLHKRHLHIQKPYKYRCIRTSIIDELYIDSSNI